MRCERQLHIHSVMNTVIALGPQVVCICCDEPRLSGNRNKVHRNPLHLKPSDASRSLLSTWCKARGQAGMHRIFYNLREKKKMSKFGGQEVSIIRICCCYYYLLDVACTRSSRARLEKAGTDVWTDKMARFVPVVFCFKGRIVLVEKLSTKHYLFSTFCNTQTPPPPT